MSRVSLPSRQRLSRRVQFFGDASSYRTSLQNRSDLTQWQKLIMLDPEGQSLANYMAHNAAAPDLFPMPIPAEYLEYVKDMGGSVSAPPFQDAPVTAALPSNIGIPNPTNPFGPVEVAPRPVIPPATVPYTFVPPPVQTVVDDSGKVETREKTNSLILPAAFAVAAFLLLKG